MLTLKHNERRIKEQEGFRQVLRTYFPNGQYKNSRILDICVGIANEEPLLIEHFGENTELIGLDSNKSLEKLLNELGRKSVIIGDIRELEKYVKGKFSLVIGRNVPLNPNYNNWGEDVPDYWPEVFENLLRFMEFNSTLFLTLVREDEFYRAQEILGNIGYRLKVKERNPVIVQSDYIGVRGADTKDHYVVIAQPPLQLRLFLTPNPITANH